MKFFLPLTVLLLALASFVRAADDPAEGVKAATKVREIFEAKCLDCHGPELPRPKGKFGYVLDLKRVADNPDYIERGKPDKSDLFKMVEDDEMPGEDANVPPLTRDEKDIVKRWIELGAPDAPQVAGETTSAAPKTAEAKQLMPFWKRLLRYIGRMHPVSTHFPVALMFVAVFAEGIAWWTRRDSWLQTVRFLVVLAALGAISAAALGWINAYFASYVGQAAPILKWHRWLGTGTAIWAVVCAALAMIHECREGTTERQRLRGALLLGAFLVGVSGFLGSALIYGLDHYAWN
ncbi:hypothetical protein CfE428DRAFT_1192 [Chthoniobacter flavus Ellin428]|uniref:DUF2231 domain-containing protein n=1 Tax=Chthoniobacter flavus Ellin428 TaxID=497964 RepID=B4CXA1_9BACT|nr:DUF2231 domain-containing protein [Chthoniobacter flavus]EDY20899.1 hypothetical protein CfE428DRAFT_1192 [Chthoniobacter flavus Ellin428]TCO88633.1 putative membrane protein [Chthoniobacter flavus]